MDDPREKMQADLKEAMRAREQQRISVIRFGLNAIKQEEIDRQTKLDAQEVLAILGREAKKRRESIAEAEKLGRPDIVETEKAELALLEVYLPQQLSAEMITDLARQAIAQSGATSPKDMGAVMKVLMPKVKGQADGQLVNQIVRNLLSGQS